MAINLIPAPHAGSLVKEYIKSNRLYQSALARDLGRRPETVSAYLKSNSLHTRVLFELSQALNRNFFSDIASLLPSAMSAAPTPKDQRVTELEKQLADMKTERDNLQKVLDILREK